MIFPSVFAIAAELSMGRAVRSMKASVFPATVAGRVRFVVYRVGRFRDRLVAYSDHAYEAAVLYVKVIQT